MIRHCTILRSAILALLLCLALPVRPAQAKAAKAGLSTEVMKRFILVTSRDDEGKENFHLVFARKAAGISGFYDGRVDPKHLINLAATAHDHETALLSYQLRTIGDRGQKAYVPAPPRDIEDLARLMQEYPGLVRDDLADEAFEVVYSGPVRTVVRIAGKYSADRTSLNANPMLRYESLYTVYASGHMFVEHSLFRRGPRIPEAINLLSVNGAGLESYTALPSHEAARQHVLKVPTSFVLLAGDTPSVRADLLVVPEAPRLPIVSWGELYRTGGGRVSYLRCRLLLPQPGRGIEPGQLTWRTAVFLGMHGIDDRVQARLVEKTVREPASLDFIEGWGDLDPMSQGDPKTGFSRRDGAWHVVSGPDGVAFRMTVNNVSRYSPRLVVSGWNDARPESVSIERVRMKEGRDYLVQLERIESEKGDRRGFNVPPQFRLIVQFLKVVQTDDVRFVIRRRELDLPELPAKRTDQPPSRR